MEPSWGGKYVARCVSVLITDLLLSVVCPPSPIPHPHPTPPCSISTIWEPVRNAES